MNHRADRDEAPACHTGTVVWPLRLAFVAGLFLSLLLLGCTDRSPREGEAATLESRYEQSVLPELQQAKGDCEQVAMAIANIEAWINSVESAALADEFAREVRDARALGLKNVTQCWKEAIKPCVERSDRARMSRLRALSESALKLGGAKKDFDPDDPKLRCKTARRNVAATTDCPALNATAWWATIRYTADVAGVDGKHRLERQLTTEIHADLTGKPGPNGNSFESWSPEGKATVRLKQYYDGALEYSAVGEGAPVPGDSKQIKDSRILMSISKHDCSYNFYSSGTVVGKTYFTGPPARAQTGPIGYGTLTVRKQPATGDRFVGSATLPTVSGSDIENNSVTKPDAYFHDIQTGSGAVQVDWEFVAIEHP